MEPSSQEIKNLLEQLLERVAISDGNLQELLDSKATLVESYDISPDIRQVIQNSMNEAAVEKQYWKILLDRYVKYDQVLKIILAISLSGIVAGWITEAKLGNWKDYLENIWLLLAGISSAIAVAMPFLQWEQKIKDAALQYSRRNNIHSRYHLLHIQSNKMRDNQLYQIYRDIRIDETSLDDAAHSIPDYKKLRKKISQELHPNSKANMSEARG